MTDKQIIIDSVDVSVCDELHINKANTIICDITGYLCEDRPNCYYKQLKRKEQKLAKIKRILVINARELEENLSHDYGKQILQIIEGKDNE